MTYDMISGATTMTMGGGVAAGACP